MARKYSWYHADRHATYKKNDVIKFTGAYYTSADGKEKWGTHKKTSRYFNSYYTNSEWEVKAPICFGKVKDQMWAYAKPSTIISGGTLDTYTIKYNANGGKGAPDSQTKTYGKTLTLRTSKPTRTGYTFVGWATSSSASSASYKAGDSFTSNKNTTLYAVWSPYKHTVKYNANGGSGAPNNQTKTYGSTIFISKVTPTRTGHDFVKWNTESDGSGTSYTSGQEYGYDQNGGTVTLYAIWKVHTYEVKYNANGGSNAPSAQTKTHGVDLTIRTGIPTRDNHTFLGWGTSSNDTSVDYKAGGKYTDNKAITLYAIWKINNYTITYELDGGTNNANNKSSVVIGSTYILSEPSKKGHTFVGWHLNSKSGTIVTAIDSSNTSNVTLFAEWKINTYTIKIYLNGGTHNGQSEVNDIKATYGSTIDLFIPVKENHDFNRWSVAGSGSLSSDNLSFTVGDSDVTLKALWGLDILVVTYDANGGTLGSWSDGYTPPVYDESGENIFSSINVYMGGSNASVQYQYGDDIAKYLIPEVTRNRHIFLGWYNGDEKVESPYAITQDLNLIAKWRKVDNCYSYNHKERAFINSLPHSFVNDENNSLKPEEGFIYVFKNGRFRKGYIQ